MICKYCGTLLEDNSKFCNNCGNNLEVGNIFMPPQQTYYYPPKVKEPGRGFAIASMVLGILSVVLGHLILGILAIIFGGVAKSKGSYSRMATAGIVCGVIGCILYFLYLIFLASFINEYIQYIPYY